MIFGQLPTSQQKFAISTNRQCSYYSVLAALMARLLRPVERLYSETQNQLVSAGVTGHQRILNGTVEDSSRLE